MNKFKKIIKIGLIICGINFQVETFSASTSANNMISKKSILSSNLVEQVTEKVSNNNIVKNSANINNLSIAKLPNISKVAVTTTVPPCSLNGNRLANATVDVGYDSAYANREYYAKTNAHKQLVSVTANEIILQSDSKEPVLSNNRYCPDEAKVPGTEILDLDEGHAMADSLGGVANAYNITPQNTDLNRYGAQDFFESEIRQAIKSKKKVTDFVYNIYYSNTQTMIPSKYAVRYKINGITRKYTFINTTVSNKATVNQKNGWYWGSKAYNSQGNYLYTHYTNGVRDESRLYLKKKATKSNLLTSYVYKNDKVSLKKSYYTNGKIKEERTYWSNGKVKRVKKYNSKGKLKTTNYYTTSGKKTTA